MPAVSDAASASLAKRLGRLLTPRGWGLLANAILLAIVGALVRIVELLPLALAAGVLLIGALVWVRVRPWWVEEQRVVTPARVALGTVARVELTVFNLDKRRSPVLSARDPFAGGPRDAYFALAPLEPGASVQASYQLPTARRGVFPLGPLQFRLSDPFGLAAVERRRGSPFLVCVHPAFERLPSLRGGRGVPDGVDGSANPLQQRGEEFDGLREYRTGDDLRRVHWASSARHDHLMIRQDHDVEDPRTLLVGDLRAGLHTTASFERTLSVLASLADAGLQEGQSIRILLNGGADSQWGTGPTHRLAVLDLLARAEPVGTNHAISVRRLRWDHAQNCSTIIVTSDGISDADLAEPSAGTHQEDAPVVVTIEREGLVLAPHRDGRRRVSVHPETPFATAWSTRHATIG